MSKAYGYCRISTVKQSIERQNRNIRNAYPEAVIIEEVYTGTRTDGRKEFEKLCKTVKQGDMIVFDSVSRMSRNAAEGFELYNRFFANNVELVFLKEPHISTATYKQALDNQIQAAFNSGDMATDELMGAITNALNRYMMRLAERQIVIAFEQSEKEVADLHQRTKEGIETARINGKQIGQRQGARLNVKKAAPAKEIILKHSKDFNGTLSDKECITLTGLARNTYYRYKKELKQQI